ncbi:hypothetical protein FVR03_03250 [Pontibacter qinzhouensis]|uniref:DUF304 domain-containing protein n=1 Tax=Pontibacter qinzhouensis TaxID=2603253 RepID=A0A5C8KE22_9BACT|nr:hypothetical protein [Pontibacter qinzhouensis]TXK51560.1 hypothetical protein FVR03_03250 [Pontibacter qinzhouensis]
MSPTSNNARSSLIVQLSPTRNALLSFMVQFTLALFWLGWAVYILAQRDPFSESTLLYYVFLFAALSFLVYVVLQNTSVFGVQSYIEVTSEYIVHKEGVFRKKELATIPQIKAIQLAQRSMLIQERDGSELLLNLRQVRKKRDIRRLKDKIQELAAKHQFEMSTLDSK